MILAILGMVIGLAVGGVSIGLLVKEKGDRESRRIYGVLTGISAAVFIGRLVLLLFSL